MGRAYNTHRGEDERITDLGEEDRKKKPLGRTRRRWEENIKMVLREISSGDTDWINPDQDKHQWRDTVNTKIKLRVPQNYGKFLSS
jgi:hypothetical protein